MNDNVMREKGLMDDDGDDDDCGYLPKRQDRREREAIMPALPCLRPNGSSILDDREGRKQHPSPWGVFFSNSAQAPGDIMRRELDFFLYLS